MKILVRIIDAESKHWGEILKIYSPYIENTVVTFEYTVPTLESFCDRCEDIKSKYPFLVCEIDGHIAGYCYAHPRGQREGYKWSFDLSVYIHPEYHRRHIGKALYKAVCDILKVMGTYNVYGLLSAGNAQSRLFHEGLGFKEVATLPKVGYKLGQWIDLVYYHRSLRDYDQNPKELLSIDYVRSLPEYMKILKEAEKEIKL